MSLVPSCDAARPALLVFPDRGSTALPAWTRAGMALARGHHSGTSPAGAFANSLLTNLATTGGTCRHLTPRTLAVSDTKEHATAPDGTDASCSQNKCSNLAELHPERYHHGSQRPRRQSTGLMRGSHDLADVPHLLVRQIVSQAIEHVQRRRRINERCGADLHRAGAGEQELRGVSA